MNHRSTAGWRRQGSARSPPSPSCSRKRLPASPTPPSSPLPSDPGRSPVARESRPAPEPVAADELIETLDAMPHRETIDDLDALLAALPPEIVAAVRSLPEVEA